MKFFSDDLLQQRIFNFRTMFVLAVFSCLFLVHSKGAPAAQIQKHVLLIYESRSDMLANVIIDRAIRKALSEKFSVDLDIYSEYFETSPSMKEDFPLSISRRAARTFSRKVCFAPSVASSSARRGSSAGALRICSSSSSMIFSSFSSMRA